MAVSTSVPANWNLPLFWATVDGSMAGNLTQAQAALIVGQYDSVHGTIDGSGQNVPVPIGSAAQAKSYFGAGSMLARMVQQWFNVNTTQLLYCIPVADPAAGVAATGSIVISGSSFDGGGVLTVYIAGQKIAVVVASTDTPQSVATNLAAAINAATDLPVTASPSTGTVALTAKWKGLTGNDIQVATNFIGPAQGEYLPSGMTVTITAMSSGSGAPDCTSAIAAIQVFQFLYVAMPYTDPATMAVWNTEFGFGSAGRWNYTRQQYGIVLNAIRGSYATLISWGAGVNSPTMTTLAVEPQAQTPIWEWCAEYAGLAALALTDDPARPLQTLEFQGLLPAPIQQRFSQAQLNNLTNAGLAIQSVTADGNPMILREQMQYQFNSYGQGDTAFALATTLATLAELLSRLRQAITSNFGRVKLIPDGTRISPGQAAVTPTDIKAALITQFKLAEWDGLVSDLTDFMANLVVQIDDQNPNRVDVLWPPQLAGQLRVFAMLAQFRLLYPDVALSGGTGTIGAA